ncbi:MAG: DUF5694 domain-containing protein [Bacteroidota bacterium]
MMNKATKAALVLIAVVGLNGFHYKIKAGVDQTSPRPKIALLGVFHFAGSAGDIAAIQLEDPLGAVRQKEIKDLVAMLEEYRPTKILVEFPKDRQRELTQRFNDYLAADFELGVSETYQVGFRLAKALGHQDIFAIDHKLDLPMNEVVMYSQRTNQMQDFNEFVAGIQSLMSQETKKLRELTIAEYLAQMNSDSVDQVANELYLKDLLVFGDSTAEAGVEVAAQWWKRNMMIYKNITETIDKEEDRLLVIIGSAHRAVIKDFLLDRSDLEYVEVRQYLKAR